jgi:hypothetical protein
MAVICPEVPNPWVLGAQDRITQPPVSAPSQFLEHFSYNAQIGRRRMNGADGLNEWK